MLDLLFNNFVTLAKAVSLFIASLHSEPICSQICCMQRPIRWFPTVWLLFGRGTFCPPWFWGMKDILGRRWDHSIVHPWVLVSSPLTRMVFSSSVTAYIALAVIWWCGCTCVYVVHNEINESCWEADFLARCHYAFRHKIIFPALRDVFAYSDRSACRLSVGRIVYCGQTEQDGHIVCIEVE